MDVTTISTVISSIGFPIVACCALFYLYDKAITKLTSTLEKIDNTLEMIVSKIENLEKQVSDK